MSLYFGILISTGINLCAYPLTPKNTLITDPPEPPPMTVTLIRVHFDWFHETNEFALRIIFATNLYIIGKCTLYPSNALLSIAVVPLSTIIPSGGFCLDEKEEKDKN